MSAVKFRSVRVRGRDGGGGSMWKNRKSEPIIGNVASASGQPEASSRGLIRRKFADTDYRFTLKLHTL